MGIYLGTSENNSKADTEEMDMQKKNMLEWKSIMYSSGRISIN